MNRSLANITKDEIENFILPFIPINKRGFKANVDLCDVYLCIVHKLKSGCQWREIFVQLPSVKYGFSWQTVYYYYRKWCRINLFEDTFQLYLYIKKDCLNTEHLNLDGTHSIVKRAAQTSAYQGRKKAVTSNLLVLTDARGIPLSFSNIISGNHNDLYNIVPEFCQMTQQLKSCDIDATNSVLNADKGFDSKLFRRAIQRRGMIANIKENKRKRKQAKPGRKREFYEKVYKQRYVNERCFAWMDSFRTLLVRYDTLDSCWRNWHFIAAFLLILKV